MKLLIALALAAAPSALAMAPYVPVDDPTATPSASPTKDPTPAPTVEKNGCGEPCADVVTISPTSFPTIESGTCYVVDGTFPSNGITVPDGVNCAKITVPSGSSLGAIDAHLLRPSFAPHPTKR